MLDNLGFGEIAMLALMALLFFGPERLPQIGASIGRWIATLTQSSKAFMTEWQEEALVVYDAVKEVKDIRDEIFAARAEIASTMTTARDDVTGALSGARADVQAQVRGATTFSLTPERSGDAGTSQIQRASAGHLVGTEGSTEALSSPPDVAEQRHQLASPPRSIEPQQRSRQHRGKAEMPIRSRSAPGGAEGGNPDRAIERTNEILDGLRQKRSETEPTAESSPTLSSLHETISSLESDVQALREELARTRAELSTRSEAPQVPPSGQVRPRAEPSATIPKTDPVPHPQPVHTGEQAGDPL